MGSIVLRSDGFVRDAGRLTECEDEETHGSTVSTVGDTVGSTVGPSVAMIGDKVGFIVGSIVLRRCVEVRLNPFRST